MHQLLRSLGLFQARRLDQGCLGLCCHAGRWLTTLTRLYAFLHCCCCVSFAVLRCVVSSAVLCWVAEETIRGPCA